LGGTNSSVVRKVKQQIHEQLGVPLVDVTPGLEPQGKELYLDADSVHLNALGNAIVAERLHEVLTNQLER
jgi:lysophospholipase L1-like esterase